MNAETAKRHLSHDPEDSPCTCGAESIGKPHKPWCQKRAGEPVDDYAAKVTAVGPVESVSGRSEPRPELCPVCEGPLARHIGGKPCVVSPPRKARGLYDLPVFGWAWSEDSKDKRA